MSTMIKLCGLYKSTFTKGGKKSTMLSGSFTYSTKILIFENEHKREGKKDPDFFMYLDEKKKGEG